MPEIKTVRVVSVSDLFSADDLELFQNEVNNRWTWGDTAMTLVPINEVRDTAFELSILSEKIAALDEDIMVDLEN